MATYIHQIGEWPRLRFDSARLEERLGSVRHRQGRLIGRMESLGFSLRAEAVLQTLTEDVLKSSEIEGEILDKAQVRSSIARRLGMDIGALIPTDRDVEGVVEMMLDATQNFQAPLTEDRLFAWHASLFPTGRSGMGKIVVGAWRTAASGPMQVVSGPIGRERVHYEAPAADSLAAEMSAFLEWFNAGPSLDPVLKAGLAHLWFVTVHPFEDGNGRIARAIADMALARSEGSPQRFYSMSAQIRSERKAYYQILETTQKGDLDITNWLLWFLACLERAFEGAEATLVDVLRKARFWEALEGQVLNPRQRKVINRVLDGFEGKLTSFNWATITKVSPDTALRDIGDLVGRGILTKDVGGGRSTSYSLAEMDKGEALVVPKAGRPLVKVMALGSPASGENQGFMAGRIQVPEDFDQMGAGEIDDLFAGPTE
ncbi:Fic family protein [Phenylobacterium sp.]|uniref:Fic family protein n=1 Tax=Phenylobacterium sp. TaxID=1871053 RepID=UPI00286DF063|nr:Fic family protein [Phenylobacterium sp.]